MSTDDDRQPEHDDTSRRARRRSPDAPAGAKRRFGRRRNVDVEATGGLTVSTPDGAIVHVAPANVAAGVRYLLARLQLNDAAGVPSRFGLTSALHGEGVTYVARTLGAVIAHDLGRRVCVVDLNWWSTGEPTGGDGIAEVLAGRCSVDAALIETSHRGLWLMPPGHVDIAERPVLAKHRDLDTVLDDLAMRFDHLLIELPPVRVSSDALTLVRLCDAYAMVVRHGVTPADVVRSAADELSGAVSLGVILNRTATRVPASLARLVGT